MEIIYKLFYLPLWADFRSLISSFQKNLCTEKKNIYIYIYLKFKKNLIWLWERERDGVNHCEGKVGWDLVQKKFWSISQPLSFDESLPTEIWRNNQIEEKRILKFRNEESDGMRSVPFVDQGRRGAHPWYWVETRQRWFEQTLAASGSLFPAILLFSNPNYILNNLANNRPSLFFLTVLIFFFF